MDETNKEMLMDVVRTLVKGVCGGLVVKGYITADQLTMLAGGAGICLMLVWSWVSTYWLTKKA
jgi:hypothetical protein